MDAEQLAQLFHETYERLAPKFNYETRKASSVPWNDVPDNNKRLMIAVAGEVLKLLNKEQKKYRNALDHLDAKIGRCVDKSPWGIVTQAVRVLKHTQQQEKDLIEQNEELRKQIKEE